MTGKRLPSEFESQYGDAWESVTVSLLVCGHTFADLDEEKFFGERVTETVGTQIQFEFFHGETAIGRLEIGKPIVQSWIK
jgi:hypothetical protein